METLYLLAGIYGQEQNIKKEVETVEKAMALAREINDQVWMFHLYSYLSEMFSGNLICWNLFVIRLWRYKVLRMKKLMNLMPIPYFC